MNFGLHLPLMDFGGNPYTLDHLITYAETGQDLGFSGLAANDHLVFSKPWLDGPTSLAAVLSHSFPNALATMWTYITENERESERMLNEVLAPAINHPVAELRERLPIGSARDCADKLAAYQKVGVQRIYLWPLADEIEQIKNFMKQVVPLMDGKLKT